MSDAPRGNVFDNDLLGTSDAAMPSGIAGTASAWEARDSTAPAGTWDMDPDTVPTVSGGNVASGVAVDFVESTTGGVSIDLRAAGERTAAGGGGGPGAPRSAGAGVGAAAGPPPLGPEKTAFYQLAHYRGFFDVDTIDVMKRIIGAIAFRRDFFAEVEAKPDLYGPFWLVTTTVFLMAMISNGLDYVATRDAAATNGGAWQWEGDLQKVVSGAIICYGYVFGGGTALWVWLKVISLAQIGLTPLWCIYGYSMAIWLPVACVAVVPHALFLWILCIGASLYSGIFLVLNLKVPIAECLVPSRQAGTMLSVFLVHQAVGVLLRIFVFTYGTSHDS